MAEAEDLCSQIAVIRAGKLVATGTPEDLQSQAGEPWIEVKGRGFTPQLLEQLRSHPMVSGIKAGVGQLEIGLIQGVQTPELVHLMVTGGAEVAEVRPGSASLEDVFLTLMAEESA